MAIAKLQRNTSSKEDDENYASLPILSSIHENTFEEHGNRKAPNKYQITIFLYHSQGVELHVKLVSEASAESVSGEIRDGLIGTKEKSTI